MLGLGLPVVSRPPVEDVEQAELHPQPPPATVPTTLPPAPITPTTVTQGAAQPAIAAPAPSAPPRVAARSNPPASVTSPAGGSLEQRGAAALALLDYPWAAIGYRIVFSGPRSGLLGLATGDTRQIDIYVRPSQTAAEIARTIAHELGHALDFSMTTGQERRSYRQIRGLDDRPWYPECGTCSDYASPAGDWAEVFAYWLLGPGRFASELAPPPTATQLEALGPLFAVTVTAPSAPAGATTTATPPATTATTTTTATSPTTTSTPTTTTVTTATTTTTTPGRPPAAGPGRQRGLIDLLGG